MRVYTILKVALGIKYFPYAGAYELADRLNVSLKTIRTCYREAQLVSESWLPDLVSPEQLARLSGADLTILYYLYTADPAQKIVSHCFNVNMGEKTFKKALKNLRRENLLELGTKGKLNSYNIQRVTEPVAILLN